jgi:hypothetical protein
MRDEVEHRSAGKRNGPDKAMTGKVDAIFSE